MPTFIVYVNAERVPVVATAQTEEKAEAVAEKAVAKRLGIAEDNVLMDSIERCLTTKEAPDD